MTQKAVIFVYLSVKDNKILHKMTSTKFKLTQFGAVELTKMHEWVFCERITIYVLI